MLPKLTLPHTKCPKTHRHVTLKKDCQNIPKHTNMLPKSIVNRIGRGEGGVVDDDHKDSDDHLMMTIMIIMIAKELAGGRF